MSTGAVVLNVPASALLYLSIPVIPKINMIEREAYHMTRDEDRDRDRLNFRQEDRLLDRVENVTGGDSPVRDRLNNALDRVPRGPLGKGGEGDIAGGAGYFAVKTGQLAVLPIPGVRQPGFSTISHGVEIQDRSEIHTVRIFAVSKQVAKFAAEYEVSAPSNIDYVTGEINTTSIEEINPRGTYSTWEVVVEVADRGEAEV